MLLGAPSAYAASPPADPPAYGAAVTRALELVTAGDAAGAAAEMRSSGLDTGEAEAYHDLVAKPPDLSDAESRLRAARAALEDPAPAGDPVQERAEIKRILSLSRYAGNQPSAWDRFWNWVGERIVGWLNSLKLPAGTLDIPTWIWLALLVAAVAIAAIGVALIAGLSSRSRRRRLAAATELEPARMVRERFGEADRLSAAGDWNGAVRALAEAVATRLSGEPWWATSPQTLRELFRNAGRLDGLRPLLLAFETVVYARRSIDEPAYRAAETAAQAIRVQPATEEVAA